MKKKISFRMFCSVVGRGLWQAVCWVGGMFGIKDGSSLGRFAKRVFMVSIAAIALMFAVGFGIGFVEHYILKSHRGGDRRHYDTTKVSNLLGDNYTYYSDYWNPGYVRNNITGEIVLDDIVWLYEPAAGDSLAVYKTNENKRGYFNIYTGKVQITPQYGKAWIFSNGLASVMKDGKIVFIDSHGNRAFEKSFRHPKNLNGYIFHGDHCVVESVNDKVGLINKTGKWVLAPEYDEIVSVRDNWWVVAIGDKQGIVDNSMGWILPIEYNDIYIQPDGEGLFASRDGVRKKYDLAGNVLEDFVVTDTRKLLYATDEHDEEGNPVMKPSDCMAYGIGQNREGLMSAAGKPLTKALYCNITAIAPNRFLAEMVMGEGIILDSRGNRVEH